MSASYLRNGLAQASGCIRRALGDGRGATAVEYGLIVAGISVVIIGALSEIGSTVGGYFQSILDLF